MPNLKTAIKFAAHDKEFAAEFIKNPEDFKTGFKLSDAQVAAIKKVGVAGKLGPLADDINYQG